MHKARGFTLLELIAVLGLLGTLAVTAVSALDLSDYEPIAEAEGLKRSLRFAQAKAMSEDAVGGDRWGLNLTAAGYQLFEAGAASGLALPGHAGDDHAYEHGVTMTSAAGELSFDYRGQPYWNGTLEASGTRTITVGGQTVTVTGGTGFIP